jgi:hypothetical protein
MSGDDAPDPPGRDVVLGQQEAAEHEKHEEHEGAARGGHILVAEQGAREAEQADAHVVQHEQQQDQREEPAIISLHRASTCMPAAW